MKEFMDDNFLLKSKTAEILFHDYAQKMPIIDYHCHIQPKEIAENKTFENLTQVWLGGDHYKWRLIRSNGTPEDKITGTTSSDWEKFQEFAKVLPKAIGNPLYHWTHLELKRFFNCNLTLSEDTAEEIWNICNPKLHQPEMSVQGIIKQSNVKVICTTDDPADSLEWHQKIEKDASCTAKVVPAMRPDAIMRIDAIGYKDYLVKLGQSTSLEIKTIDDIRQALHKRMDFFEKMGCRVTDHALEYIFYRPADDTKINKTIHKALQKESLTVQEIEEYKTAILFFLAGEYSKRDWAMQIHYSALRNNNTKMYNKLGPDTGFDCLATYNCAEGITAFLDALNSADILPKTILYSLNPADNILLGSIIGSFQGTEAFGKIQQGCAWWFNDSKAGITNQLTNIANLSVLGNILGMVTDSRSFLSYPRHEYYRRILCNFMGDLVENGEYPSDIKYLGKLVQNISYNNAKEYFKFPI
ncbi:glucuronate isomerase [Pectinatus cerevisiiphilus]|uniref:Uronate isomerase n=1 Tax=Pectinatus cerevisiiphilus TaxID=86956 RepID=A0A4V2URV4_9FIRM|nr:glucuronate isomerase [Pectinatus cerevisiiphilus]TCS79032.1 glucuronate isomerase [Pectinatus cerevisiiphilus]